MNVGELKKLLEGVDDNVQVLAPCSADEFDCRFYSPCNIESGLTKMGTDMELTDEDIEEAELLNKQLTEEDAFLIIPHGFGEKKDDTHQLN